MLQLTAENLSKTIALFLLEDDAITVSLLKGELSWADANELGPEMEEPIEEPKEEEKPRTTRVCWGETTVIEEKPKQTVADRLIGMLMKSVAPKPIVVADPMTTTQRIVSLLNASKPAFDSRSVNPGQIKTLVVRNLPRDASAQEIGEMLECHGVIRDVYIPKNLDKNSPYYGTIKGFALVKFMSPHDSARAFVAEEGRAMLRGKKLIFEFAKEDR